MFRLPLDGPRVGRHGFQRTPEREKYVSPVVVCFRMVRTEIEQRVVGFERFPVPVLVLPRESEIVARIDIIRLVLDCVDVVAGRLANTAQ